MLLMFRALLLLMLVVVLLAEEQYVDFYSGYDDYVVAHDVGNYGLCKEDLWHSTKVGDEVCMKELGCFKLTNDYYHPQYRPCNVLPEPRSLIHTRFILFTRRDLSRGKFLIADDEKTIRESGFNANHSTKFIVHGYEENPLHDKWVLVLMKEFLAYNETNVIIVDWNRGSQAPYIQAVANARVVGAEIARMTNALKKFGNLTTNMMHIIGHGLGAHVAGYAGQSILPMVSRITGLDPAYKFFCNLPDNVRLDKADAEFVDVIHSELKDYDSGHGTCHKLGHLDFYPDDQTVTAHLHYEVTSDHQRAAAMFISSIRNGSCLMIGYYCRSYKAFLRGECADCGTDGSRCAPVGYHSDRYIPFKDSNFSTMYLVSGSYPSICLYEYRLQMLLQNKDSNLENHSKTGNLLLLLRGDKKPLFLHLRFYSMNNGQEYTFLVTSSVDIGIVRNVTTRWENQGHYHEQFSSGQTIWHYQDRNVSIERINVTQLNFQPEEMRGPTQLSFCKSDAQNEPGWNIFLPATCR
ncbi:pancreatic lipase-related protein 2-like [Uloborus diversus]|uniref:pancreatic lipase-related protein 2-like n=1 Tax=Uloborus diversus TaxID=327109 RepID=UPI002409E8B2|nr:pancreatic lipase-related protein 2-like [Uloborus diversus]